MHGLFFLLQLNMCTETVVRSEYMYIFLCSSYSWAYLFSATEYVHWNRLSVRSHYISVQFLFMGWSFLWSRAAALKTVVRSQYISVQLLFIGWSFLWNRAALKLLSGLNILYLRAALKGLVSLVEWGTLQQLSGLNVFQCSSYSGAGLSWRMEYTVTVVRSQCISVQLLFMGWSFLWNGVHWNSCQVSMYFSAALIRGLAFWIRLCQLKLLEWGKASVLNLNKYTAQWNSVQVAINVSSKWLYIHSREVR